MNVREKDLIWIYIVNFNSVSNRCKSIIDLVRSLPGRDFCGDTKRWKIYNEDKDMLMNGIENIKDSENLNIVINEI